MPPGSSPRPPHSFRLPPVDAATDRLKFSGDNAFHRELRRRVDDYFAQSEPKQRDTGRMYLKTAGILAPFVASYVLVVFFAAAWWQGLLLSVALGITMAQIGFNIQHDAGHQAYSERRSVNKWLARTLDLV